MMTGELPGKGGMTEYGGCGFFAVTGKAFIKAMGLFPRRRDDAISNHDRSAK